MRLAKLLARMQLQAEEASRQQRLQEREEARHPVVTQDIRVNRDCQMIRHLLKKTSEIKLELEVKKRLEDVQQKHLKAAKELREANLTPAERKARAEETHRGQILFSRIVPENHPDWREHATETFRNRKL